MAYVLDGMLFYHRDTNLYTCEERGTDVRVKCLAQEYNNVPWHGPLVPELSALTMRPLHLPHFCKEMHSYNNKPKHELPKKHIGYNKLASFHPPGFI